MYDIEHNHEYLDGTSTTTIVGMQEICHRPRWWRVLPTAAKIENVFDMSKYRVSIELSMNLVNIMNILTIDVKYY